MTATENTTAAARNKAPPREAPMPADPVKNRVDMAMRRGNRPLQGTKLLVSMAIFRSLSESMMRHPTTPAALQPNPIHMVREISGVFFFCCYTSNKAVIYPYLLYLMPLSATIFCVISLFYLDTVNQLSKQRFCQFLYIGDFIQ